MMTPVKRSRVIPALALTATLALAGCSGVGSDLGVAVEGDEYSVTELQRATTELNEVAANLQEPLPAFQQTDPQQVIADLALLPLLDEVFAGSPAEVTQARVRQFLSGAGVSDPGEATLEAARSRTYQSALGDPATFQDPAMAGVLERAQAVTEEELAEIDVEVNPRYGSWDVANGGVVPRVPEWITTTDGS
jgi:hypothetical protein